MRAPIGKVIMPSCGKCHTCSAAIQIVLGHEEWCEQDQLYQQPLAHGWSNSSPTEAEQRACEDLAALNQSSPETNSPADQPTPTGSVTADENPFADMEIISRYTRAEAMADGSLVEIPMETLQEFGITFPTAMTRAVWEENVRVPDTLLGLQDESGRLADILVMFRLEAKRTNSAYLTFRVLILREAKENGHEEVTLKAVCDGGDDGHPVITIMMAHES
jgi:hypothetical protein